MTHPSGAGYKHTPAFVDRMKRAEGGEVQPPADGSDMEMRRSMQESPTLPNNIHGASDADLDAYNARHKSLQDRGRGPALDDAVTPRARGGRVRKRAEGGVTGPESLSDAGADTSPMAVEEKGRTIPMSQKEAMSGMNQPAQTMSGQGGSLNAALKGD